MNINILAMLLVLSSYRSALTRNARHVRASIVQGYRVTAMATG